MSAVAHTSESKSTTRVSRAVAHGVQARLQVGPTNDSYEQEADRVAARVVGSGPTRATSAGGDGSPSAGGISSPGAPVISRLVRRQAEEEPQAKLQRQEEEPQAKIQKQEEEPQAKLQRQEDEPQMKMQRQKEEPQAKVQRQEEEEAQTKAQRQEEEPQTKLQREEEEPQARLQRQEEEPQAKLQRQEEEPQAKLQRQEEEEAQAKVQRQEEEEAQTKIEPRANVRDKQMYPVLGRVENKLFANKGKGEAMEDDVRVDMEGRFGADFSQVRIHKGGDAAHMSKELQAQAFTHGSDVFFNDGKYEPDSVRGKILLAHELTHVVQQGAAQQVPEQKVQQNNAQKDAPVPDPADVKAKEAEKQTEEIEQQPPGAALGEGAGPDGATAGMPGTEGEQPAASPPQEGEAKDAEEGKGKEGAEKAEKGAKKGKAKGKGKSKEGKGKKGKGKSVGAFLRQTTKATFEGKKAAASQLAQNQKQKDDPETKLKQTEKAVEPPTDEAQSRANASQVETVDQVKEPEPDEAKAKEELDAALNKAVPSSLEEVDEFKEEGKGRVVGQAVKGAVVTDTQEVQATYQKIEETPAPEQPEPSEALPEIETPPETPPLDMGDGVVGTVQEEHTDLSDFENETEAMLEEQPIPVEELEKVDEGDLAEAMQERKKVKEQVKEGPKEVKKLEQEEKQKVDQDLKKEEKEGRKKMQEERQKGLEGAKGDQQNTKKTIEQKRKEVTDHINGIYEKANTTVKQKLEDLEKQALADFDKGQAKATQAFEDNVNSRINAFKRRRYDRFGGSLLWAKDKLLGMDDLPEVEQIFESEKSTFIRTIDQLIKQITKENQRVIQECKDLVADAKKEIEEYVAGLGPELQKTGQEALTEMKTKLDALDKQINDKEQELQKKLAEKREAAIQAIEEKIEAMKEEMSGLVSKIGNLLLEVALKFFKWALKKAGFDATQLMNIINKGKAVITAIVDDPIGFIMNLVNAVKGGIDNFVKNIKKHLIGGLISWLTGAMADVPIKLPDTWDLKGILSLILQVLGLTYDRIRAKLVKRVGERVVSIVETSVEIVKTLITEGPIGLWEMIKAKADEIKQQVMDGIRDWVITQLVKQAVIKLVSFLNPAGAIVQAIIAIYNTVMFFVENWQRIVEFVDGVFNSIGNIAKGQISAASQKVEQVLAMTIPIILNFLARLIGLGNIGKTITGIIKKVRKPIDKVVDAVIDKVVGFAKKLVGKAKKGVGKLKDKIISWWKVKETFTTKNGESHSLYFKGTGKSAKLVMASDAPKGIEERIEDRRKVASRKTNPKPLNAAQRDALTKAKKLKKDLDTFVAANQQTGKAASTKDIRPDIQTRLVAIRGELVKGDIIPEEEKLPLTNVTFQMAAGKSSWVKAEPLTKFPGNTTGQDLPAGGGGPSPAGWVFAQQSNKPDPSLGTTSAGTSRRSVNWVRIHLLSHLLHGPAQTWNLVPGMQGVNRNLRTLEHQTSARLKKGEHLSYKTEVVYKGGKPIAGTTMTGDEADYPSKIQVTLGKKNEGGEGYTYEAPKPIAGTYGVPGAVDVDALFAGLLSSVEAAHARLVKQGITPTWGIINDNLKITGRPKPWLTEAHKAKIKARITELNTAAGL